MSFLVMESCGSLSLKLLLVLPIGYGNSYSVRMLVSLHVFGGLFMTERGASFAGDVTCLYMYLPVSDVLKKTKEALSNFSKNVLAIFCL
jgi:hypothetical protein